MSVWASPWMRNPQAYGRPDRPLLHQIHPTGRDAHPDLGRRSRQRVASPGDGAGGLGPSQVEAMEIPTGSVRMYGFGPDTTIASRRVIGWYPIGS
jgi:hypothetical protein